MDSWYWLQDGTLNCNTIQHSNTQSRIIWSKFNRLDQSGTNNSSKKKNKPQKTFLTTCHIEEKNPNPGISLYTKLCNYDIILPTKQAQLRSFDSANKGNNNNKSIKLVTETPFTKGAKLWDRKWRGPDSATSAYSQELNSLKHCRKGSK